jgi:hypothetical protein
VIPETHYLAQYIKQTTMTYFNRICLFSCANPDKGECSYLIFKKRIFEQIKADFAEKYKSDVFPRTNMGNHFVYVQYKEREEVYKYPEELASLQSLPQEKLERKCTIVIEVAVEYYERAPGSLLRSAKEVDGRYVAGTALVDMTQPFKEKNIDGLSFPTISHLTLGDFYKDKSEERRKKKTTEIKELYTNILKNKVNEG